MATQLEIAQELISVAQIGLTYCTNEFDRERYESVLRLGGTLLAGQLERCWQEIEPFVTPNSGYATPKVEVRALIVEDGAILLVQENVDGKWALPGGWADVGLTLVENAKKEVLEEAGLEVAVERLLAVTDKNRNRQSRSAFHVYRMFLLCKVIGGAMSPGVETLDVQFFDPRSLPPLSLSRTSERELSLLLRTLDSRSRTWIE